MPGVPADNLSDEEVQALSACTALVVQAITALLLQTMRLPEGGDQVGRGVPIHHPRDPPSPFILSRKGEQLTSIQSAIHRRSNRQACQSKVLPIYGTVNVEKCHRRDAVSGRLLN